VTPCRLYARRDFPTIPSNGVPIKEGATGDPRQVDRLVFGSQSRWMRQGIEWRGIVRDTCGQPRSRNVADKGKPCKTSLPNVADPLTARLLRVIAGAGPWLLGRWPSFNTGDICGLSVQALSLGVVQSSKDAQEYLGNRGKVTHLRFWNLRLLGPSPVDPALYPVFLRAPDLPHARRV